MAITTDDRQTFQIYDYLTELRAGEFPDREAVEKFGRIDNPTNQFQHLWSGGGDRVWQVAPSKYTIKSSSVLDQFGGGGAGVGLVRMYGITTSLEEEYEDVFLQGQTEVQTQKDWWRFNFAIAGSAEQYGALNDGDITFKDSSGNLQGIIPAGLSYSQQTHFTVGKDRKAIIHTFKSNIVGNEAEVRLMYRSNFVVTANDYQNGILMSPSVPLFNAHLSTNAAENNPKLPIKVFMPYTDIWLEARCEVPQSTNIVGAGYGLEVRRTNLQA